MAGVAVEVVREELLALVDERGVERPCFWSNQARHVFHHGIELLVGELVCRIGLHLFVRLGAAEEALVMRVSDERADPLPALVVSEVRGFFTAGAADRVAGLTLLF